MKSAEIAEKEVIKRVLAVHLEAREPWVRWNQYWDTNAESRLTSRYALEMGVLLEGRLRRRYKDWHMDVEPGEAWLIGIWEPQSWQVLEGPCHELVFFISPEVLLDLHFPEMPSAQWLRPFMVSPHLRPQVLPQARGQLRNLALQAIEISEQECKDDLVFGPGWKPKQGASTHGFSRLPAPFDSGRRRMLELPPEMVCLQLRLIMVQILMRLFHSWNPPSEAMRAEPFSRISPAIHRVLQSRALVTVAEAARLCGLHRNVFSETFGRLMQMSYGEFGLHHRLQGAARDLELGQDTVKTIAARWGFNSAPHLHRWFLSHYGCTPGQYRREQRSRRDAFWFSRTLPIRHPSHLAKEEADS